MSRRKAGDREMTRQQLRKPFCLIDGKTWLRHKEGIQAALIDKMILEGKYSTEEMATEINEQFPPKRSLSKRKQRVKDHLGHLQDGDSWGNEPHKLKLKKDKGRWSFDLDR